MSYLEELHHAIQETSAKRRQDEAKWFADNPPILEFQIERDEETFEYGVWDVGEDWVVIIKSGSGKYHFNNRLPLDKKLITELGKLSK